MLKTTEILEYANILKPIHFGIDPLSIAKGESNDVSWMKTRYIKDNKNIRELYYLLTSIFVVNTKKLIYTPLNNKPIP